MLRPGVDLLLGNTLHPLFFPRVHREELPEHVPVDLLEGGCGLHKLDVIAVFTGGVHRSNKWVVCKIDGLERLELLDAGECGLRISYLVPVEPDFGQGWCCFNARSAL